MLRNINACTASHVSATGSRAPASSQGAGEAERDAFHQCLQGDPESQRQTKTRDCATQANGAQQDDSVEGSGRCARQRDDRQGNGDRADRSKTGSEGAPKTSADSNGIQRSKTPRGLAERGILRQQRKNSARSSGTGQKPEAEITPAPLPLSGPLAAANGASVPVSPQSGGGALAIDGVSLGRIGGLTALRTGIGKNGEPMVQLSVDLAALGKMGIGLELAPGGGINVWIAAAAQGAAASMRQRLSRELAAHGVQVETIETRSEIGSQTQSDSGGNNANHRFGSPENRCVPTDGVLAHDAPPRWGRAGFLQSEQRLETAQNAVTALALALHRSR